MQKLLQILLGLLIACLVGVAMFALGIAINNSSDAPFALGVAGFLMTLAALLYQARKK